MVTLNVDTEPQSSPGAGMPPSSEAAAPDDDSTFKPDATAAARDAGVDPQATEGEGLGDG